MKIEYDIQKSTGGYVIRRVVDNGRAMYVSGVNRGNYSFVWYFIRAKLFSKQTAMKHILTLAHGDMTSDDDGFGVMVERRD